MSDRMPPLTHDRMTAEQKAAAAELAAGPRGGVKGPFIPLLRSPQLMSRLQKVGEYLRYQSVLEPRLSEFVMLIVSRQWTQQFDILGLVGYFTTVSMVMNVARTPRPADAGVAPLAPFPP